MNWQMYWRKPFQFQWKKTYDPKFNLYTRWFIFGPFQAYWYTTGRVVATLLE